jgi:hypothetical protein
VRLWLDGTLVVSPASFSDQAGTERSSSPLVLHADQPYDLRLEYVEAAGRSHVRLLWSSWSQQPQVVPSARLSTPRRTEPVTLSDLERRLGQPLRGLFDRCESVEQPVHRARIACEVLRTLLPAQQANYVDADSIFAIYQFLLEQLGTSYGELGRVVAGGDKDERRRLADRLGIGDPTQPDDHHLDELLLDPGDPATFTENRLEDLFGYPSTTRAPLNPDGHGAVFSWRRQVLRGRWQAEDWPSKPPAGARPILDPDLVGAPDLNDPTPTVNWPRPPRRPMDFLEDRQRWLEQTLADIQQALQAPQAGFEGLITDRFTDANGAVRPLQLGLDVTVAHFEDLVARLRAGVDMSADLAKLQLDTDALDYLGSAWEASRRPGGLTGEDRRLVADVFLEHHKREQFPTWRAEEAARQITLSPDFFRIRPPPRPGFEFPWAPKRFRSTPELRRAWQQTLRRRITQAQTLDEQWATALNAAEDRFRVLQRDLLLLIYHDATTPAASVEQLTDRLQLDLRTGACQTTTRVAQALESVQGLLFSARNGLLAADNLVLDDPAGFDQAWQWLGAYASWHAAMATFLHPETALKPTLRLDASGAFRSLVKRLRATGPLDPETAQKEADTYEQFFRDVCSLAFEATGPVTPPGAPATAAPWHLVVARGGHTGRLYACLQDARPDHWRQAGFRRTTWEEIPGLEEIPRLDPDAEVVTLVSSRTPTGRAAAGLYVRTGQAGGRRTLFTQHDGTGWTPPREATEDALIAAAVHAGSVPPAPQLAAADAAGWPLASTDAAAILDVDGDGRKEVVVVAAPGPSGARPLGLLRELAGGLVLDARGELPPGWQLLTGKQPPMGKQPPSDAPLVVRTTLVRTPDQRREQLVVVGQQGGQPAIGLLGLAGTTPGLIVTTASPIPGGGATWPVDPNAMFVAADIDGDGFTELVAVDILDTSNRRLNVIQVRENGFALVSTQIVTSITDGGDPVAETWLWLLPVAAEPAEPTKQSLLAYSDWGPNWQLRTYVNVFAWSRTLGVFRDVPERAYLALLRDLPPIGFDPNDALSFWRQFAPTDRFLPARLGLGGSGGEFLLTAADRPETAVLRLRSPVPYVAPMTWRSAKTVPAGAAGRDWDRHVDDVLLAADLDGDGRQELVLVVPGGNQVGVAGRTAELGLELRWVTGVTVRGPGGASQGAWPAASSARFLVGDLDGDGCEEIVALQAASAAVLRGLPPRRSAFELGVRDSYGPSGISEFAVVPPTSRRWIPGREARIREGYLNNLDPDWTDPDLTYLDEAYYFLPVELALGLREAGYYTAALDWLRGLYDYERPADERKRAFLLVLNGEEELSFAGSLDWLRDPLDPHLVARTRRDSYTRFTILTVARCLIAFGDAEFTRATAESLPRARELYLRALDLLDAPELAQRTTACADVLGTLDIQIGNDELRWIWQQVPERLSRLHSLDLLAAAVRDVKAAMAQDGDLRGRVAKALRRVTRAEHDDQRAAARGGTLARDAEARRRLGQDLLSEPATGGLARRLTHNLVDTLTTGAADDQTVGLAPDWLPTIPALGGRWPLVPAPRPSFCVPANPLVAAIRRHAELNLDKLRDCRNIAGLRMRVEPYAADTGPPTADGLPTPRRGFQPLPYRYATLVERARQLVDLARQIEQSMLAAIESGERARYEELRARQDLGLARSSVRLKDLQLVQANDGVRAAELQRDRALLSARHYRALIDAGTSENEDLSLQLLQDAAVLHAASAAAHFASNFTPEKWLGFGTSASAAMFSSLAAAASTGSQIHSTLAGFERRQQEWRFQEQLSQADTRIGEQQIRLAQDEARIAAQERFIADLQVDHAEEILDFLTMRRFDNPELYEWMSAQLQQIYRFFLQQATAMAQLAEAQLAFERQEVPPAYIRADYWKPPTEGLPGQAMPDRRGLTGSARLLQDLTELDQHAFRTEQRKLQLSKTISLAQLDPVAFQRFRQTGVLPFHSSMDLFDRDFPGHYLRLVKRVRTSVIALVPPAQGIHATLSTTGPSRTVIGGETFDTVVVQRPPETVALTSPYEATGVFEFSPQPELLAPFEGIGVEADWEFRLPKAANLFDFGSVADVLVTLDYTALDSDLHQTEVLRRLDRELVGDRPFLFRDEFADAWYDLHNPDQVEAPAQPMVVTFRTQRSDYPANLEPLVIRNVALLFSRRDGAAFEVPIANLRFEDGTSRVDTGPMTTVDGLVSSRRANGNALIPLQGMVPVGEWTLSFRHGDPARDRKIRKRFADEDIQEMLLVISYAGETPPWPN